MVRILEGVSGLVLEFQRPVENCYATTPASNGRENRPYGFPHPESQLAFDVLLKKCKGCRMNSGVPCEGVDLNTITVIKSKKGVCTLIFDAQMNTNNTYLAELAPCLAENYEVQENIVNTDLV